MKFFSAYSPSSRLLACALAASIIVGVLVAWSPRFWGVTLVQYCVILTAFCWLFSLRSWNFPAASVFPVLIACWGWVQLWFAGSVVHSITRVNALGWSVAAVAFLIASQVLQKSKSRSLFLKILMWGAGVFSLLALLQMYSAPNLTLWIFPAEPGSVGTFLYKNQFAAMLEMVVPIALYAALFTQKQFWSGLTVFLLLFAGAVASASRAGAALVLLESAVMLVLAWRSGKIRLSAILVAVPGTLILLVSIAAIAGSDLAFRHFQEMRDAVRQELVKSTLAMNRDEPWSGYGLGTWPAVYPKYATFDIGRLANAAHNDWLEWWTEGGPVFAGSFALLFLVLARRALQHPWCLGVFSICLHSWVDYPTREPVLAILWFALAGALAAAGKAGRSRGREEDQTAGL